MRNALDHRRASSSRTRLRRISTWVYFVDLLRARDALDRRRRRRRSRAPSCPSAAARCGSTRPSRSRRRSSFLGMFGADRDRRDHGPRGAAGLRVPHRALLLHRADPQVANTSAAASSARSCVLLVILSSIALGGVLGLLLPGHRPRPRRARARRSPTCSRTSTVAAAEPAWSWAALLLPRRADAADAAGLHRQRPAADRLPGRAGPAARHGQQDRWRRCSTRSASSPRRGSPNTGRSASATRAWSRSRACCSGTGCCGSASAPRSSRSATWRFRFAQAGHRAAGKRAAAASPMRRRRPSPCSCAAVAPARGQRLAPAAAAGLAQLPRDGEERLLRRHRARRRAVPGRRPARPPATSSAPTRGR